MIIPEEVKQWLVHETNFLEVNITSENVSMTLSKDTEELLKFLSEGGINYKDLQISLCG
jgi:hypothetical protein